MICPNCKKNIDGAAKVCPYCQSSMASGTRCPECGHILASGERTCPECGFDVLPVKRCRKCGTALESGVQTCPECGCPVAEAVKVEVGGTARYDDRSGALAVCAMILAFLFPPAGLILGLVGVYIYSGGVHRGLSIAAAAVSFVLIIGITILLVNVIPEVNSRLSQLDNAASEVADAAEGVSEASDRIKVFVDTLKDYFA